MNDVKNQRQSFINLAIMLFILGAVTGGLGSFLASRMTCIADQCFYVTEGDNILGTKVMKVDQGTTRFLQSSPPYILGLGGVFLLAGLLKTDSEA